MIADLEGYTCLDVATAGTVLIIEDDPDIAEILRYSLEKETFKTRVAQNGEEGLYASLDNANPPSIILLDLLLPGMKGTEICRRLRREPATRTTPIIIISAKPFDNDSLELGANDYPKPMALCKLCVFSVPLWLRIRPGITTIERTEGPHTEN